MKIQKITFLFYILLAIVISWLVYHWMNPNYEKKIRQNSEEFADNRIHFERLIKDIKSKYLKDVQNSNLTDLSKTISVEYKDKFDELGIENIEISFNDNLNCSEKIIYTFNMKWGYNIRKLRTIQIIYTPCSEQTVKGYHMNSIHIDVNGEGNNWLILSDTDFI